MTKETANFTNHRELVATLSGGISKEDLIACREAGMTCVRIHGEKTSISDAAEMIRLCHKVGLTCSYDTNGKKPRVRKSEGMEQVQEGSEKGNWLKTLEIGEPMILVAETSEQMSKIFATRLSVVPQVFSGGGDEKISFADGKIICSVTKVIKNAEGVTESIEVTVDSVKDTEGLFWKMGANSTTNDIFSGDDPALTAADQIALKELKKLLPDDGPDEIAVSFISTEEQAADAVSKIRNIGFESNVLAKIETVRGVENAEQIANCCDLEVARGDLEEACKLSDGRMTLDRAEGWVIKAGWKTGRKVVIATQVADSLLKKAKSKASIEGDHLSNEEQSNIRFEFPVSDGFMLAAETKTTSVRPDGLAIIEAVDKSIQQAADFWKEKLRK